MPLKPSDSVDAFLSWLSTPALPHSSAPSVKSGLSHLTQHKLGASQSQSSAQTTSSPPLVSSNAGVRLRELSRSPLEDMALPILLTVPSMSVSALPTSPGGAPINSTGTATGNVKSSSISNPSTSVASQPSVSLPTVQAGSNWYGRGADLRLLTRCWSVVAGRYGFSIFSDVWRALGGRGPVEEDELEGRMTRSSIVSWACGARIVGSSGKSRLGLRIVGINRK